MACGYTKYELYLIWKMCYKCIWYPQHIDRDDLVKGTKRSNVGYYEDAIDSLVKKGILIKYKAKGRDDVGFPKQYKNELLEALKRHQKEYDFIKGLEYIK